MKDTRVKSKWLNEMDENKKQQKYAEETVKSVYGVV
jgi:hypothetical protein